MWSCDTPTLGPGREGARAARGSYESAPRLYLCVRTLRFSIFPPPPSRLMAHWAPSLLRYAFLSLAFFFRLLSDARWGAGPS